jgi:predicted Zn-dependent protease
MATLIVAFRVVVPVVWAEPERVGPHISLAPAGQGSPAPKPLGGAGFYLVPLDGTSEPRLRRVAGQLSRQLALRAQMMPRLRSETVDFDRDRKQLLGDALYWRVREAFPARKPPVAVIGVTDGDLYWEKASWRFALGVKDDWGYGVVSTARMDPRNLGDPPNEELLDRRLRKRVTRYVGELYFRLPRSENPRSVLGPTLAGVEELDAMSEEFCPARPGERVSC